MIVAKAARELNFIHTNLSILSLESELLLWSVKAMFSLLLVNGEDLESPSVERLAFSLSRDFVLLVSCDCIVFLQ